MRYDMCTWYAHDVTVGHCKTAEKMGKNCGEINSTNRFKKKLLLSVYKLQKAKR